MKRRLLTVVSAILVLFVVASCGKKNGADTGNDSDKRDINLKSLNFQIYCKMIQL